MLLHQGLRCLAEPRRPAIGADWQAGGFTRDGARLGARAEGSGDTVRHVPQYGGLAGRMEGLRGDVGTAKFPFVGRFPLQIARIARRPPAMTLLHLMHDIPLWVTTLAVCVGAAIYSIGLMLSTRTIYGVDKLALNNEVAGFKFAVIGVFYAVMLAFVVIAVWEDFRKTEAAVRDEAKAVVDLNRLSFALPAAGGAKIRQHLQDYVDGVREHEWETMAVGEPSDIVIGDLSQLSRAIYEVKPQSEQELALYEEALRLLSVITDNRTERLDSADGSMPGILWFVLIVGGLITLGYPAFFGSTNLVAQVLMTAALAELVALSLLLGLAFDYPFTGKVSISSLPFEHALRQMPADPPT
jgi:hypothetical protein